jgi:hypothetical protein
LRRRGFQTIVKEELVLSTIPPPLTVAMIYFIPWVVFLIVVIASVPVVNWLEKRKLRAALKEQGMEEEAVGEAEDEAADDEAGEAAEGEEPPLDAFEPSGDGGDEISEDEFAALDK